MHSWKQSLNLALRSLRKPDRLLRVALIGIGNEFMGDDAAGVLVARGMQTHAHESLLVIDAGTAPENCTALLRRFRPDLVIMVDAAQFFAVPGEVRWLQWEQTTGISASTHTLPPHMFARYITSELDCEVALIGIQPATNLPGAAVSPQVLESVDLIVRALVEEL